MDARSAIEKLLWRVVGPPLYYCDECLRVIRVNIGPDSAPIITRNCDHDTARIIAPRKAILAGKGGLSPRNRIKQSWRQIASNISGRSV